MSYQQNQPQLQSHQQSGTAQYPQFQQPQLQQPEVSQQFQQQPTGRQQSPVTAEPIAQQGQPTGQMGSPQVPTQQAPSFRVPQPMQAASQHQPVQGFGQGVPTPGPEGTVTQIPQQRAPQQFGLSQSQPQGFGLPQGQFSPPQQQLGQPQMQPSQTQIPQAQTAQLGQRAPSQAQWSAQAPSQPLQSGGASFSAPMQEVGAGSSQQVSEQSQQRSLGMPSIDIVDTPDEIVLLVDLPGYEEEDIRIQGDGQNLTISAERTEAEQEEGRRLTHERFRKLQRTVRLPARANVNEADATYENGVCKITLPKMEEEKQHEIAFQ